MKKKGQIEMSFGMIFSILLILAFLGFAFYGIQKFMSMQNAIKIGKFTSDIQEDINKMWKSTQGSQTIEYLLPSKIEAVCFANYSMPNKNNPESLYRDMRQAIYGNQNLFFYPLGTGEGIDALTLSHIDLESMIGNKNPICIETQKGKITLTIKKNFGENLVIIN